MSSDRCVGRARFALAVACLATAACDGPGAAPTTSPGAGSALTRTRIHPITDGTLDTGDPAVVAIVQRRALCDEVALPRCTGTLIAPRVVLTAAHCIDVLVPAGGFEVVFGTDLRGEPPPVYVVVAGGAVHPSYDPVTKDYDLGLLLLAEPAAVVPVALASTVLDVATVGLPVRVVGFGATAAAGVVDGKKRQGTMTIRSLAQVTFESEPGPSVSCGGDSGGPVFFNFGVGEQLVGVTSAGDPGCASYAINARVDRYVADFIEPFVAAAATAPVVISPAPAQDLCTRTCERDEDCPALLQCDGERCVLPTVEGIGGPGTWDDTACATSAECGAGSVCGRLWTDTCGCVTPCAAPPPPDDGCAIGGPARRSPTAIWLVLGIVAWLARRRSSLRRI